MRRSWMVPIGLVAVLVAGCGGDGSSTDATARDESTTASSLPVPDGPSCTETWVDGASLPRRYRGCLDEDATFVPAEARRCDSGQVLVSFGDRYYAVEGGPVNDMGGPLEESDQYRKALASCG